MSSILAILALFLSPILGVAADRKEPMRTRDFAFVSGNKKLSGFIDQPSSGNQRALILFIHGSGATDIRGENRFSDLRQRFAALGIASATWDKPGCGRSEGTFDENQSIDESAAEVLDAIAYLKREKVPGSHHLGLWSTSRGCWVAPVAASKSPAVRFWISVSGVPAEDNKFYLIKSNLPLEGRSPEQTDRLMNEWVTGRRVFMNGGDYETYLAATANLRSDPAISYFAGDLTGNRKAYEEEQSAYKNATMKPELENETLSLLRVENFPAILRGLNLPVLAMFGEKDTNVDWRKARALYETTMGRNKNASLTLKTFPNCNHAMNVSATGSVREVEGMPLDAGTKCDGYYDTQIDWLKKHVIGK